MRSYKIPSPFTYRSTPTPPGERKAFEPGHLELEPISADTPLEITKDVNRSLLSGQIDKCDLVLSTDKNVVNPKPGKIYLRKVNNQLTYTVMTAQGKIIRNKVLKGISVTEPFSLDQVNKKQVLSILSKSGHTPKIPRLIDLRAEDLGLTQKQQALYEMPQHFITKQSDQRKVAETMTPMLDEMSEQDARDVLKKMRAELEKWYNEDPNHPTNQNKIQYPASRASAAKAMELLDSSKIDQMDGPAAKEMIKKILHKGKIGDYALTHFIAKTCSRLLLLSYKTIITERIEFKGTAAGLDAFKKMLSKHLLSTVPPGERETLADTIARNFHQSGFTSATRSYFQFKFQAVAMSLMESEGAEFGKFAYVQNLVDSSTKKFTLHCDDNGTVSFKSTAMFKELQTAKGQETREAVLKGGASFVEVDSTIYLSAKQKPDEQSPEITLTSDALTIRKAPVAKNGKRATFLNTFLSLLCDDPLCGKNGIFLLNQKPEAAEMKDMATYLYFEDRILKYRVKDAEGVIEGTVPPNKLKVDSLMRIANENNGQDDIRSLAKGMPQGADKNALIALGKIAQALEQPPLKKNSGFLGFIRRAWSSGEPEKKKQQDKKVDAPATTRRMTGPSS